VKELPVTTQIIDSIMPHFEGVRAVVISGYLNDRDLFWKVNYHWEYLRWMTEHSIQIADAGTGKKGLQSVLSSLLSCKPDPEAGYRESATLGKPVDLSSQDEFNRRYRLLAESKRSFKKIVRQENLAARSRRGSRAFDLAAAPVAHPGTSKHSPGYAVDIQGENGQIKTTCRRLGATLVFDEKSHVHVEFKRGVG
jgi:hypothetical protein